MPSLLFLMLKISWALVTHTCNPIYLGGWDQEDHSSGTAGRGGYFARPCLSQYLYVIAHVCHPKLCRRLKSGLQFQVSPGKKVCETSSQWREGGARCHSSDDRKLKINKRIVVQASLGKMWDPISEITRAKRSLNSSPFYLFCRFCVELSSRVPS
jgi:hypothetical protein